MGQPRGRAHGRPSSATDRAPEGSEVGWAMLCDTQADVPSAGSLRAQLAFKDSMVRGILQFTPSIAFRYVLHRCESRDIRCRESLMVLIVESQRLARAPFPGRRGAAFRSLISLARLAPGFGCLRRGRTDVRSPPRQTGRATARGPPIARRRVVKRVRGSFCWAELSTMILPQVHLRKPCYDFSFL